MQTPSDTSPTCPLCYHSESDLFHQDRKRPYRRCTRCHFVFVDPQFHLSSAAEKAEYDRHQNHPDDPGYRRFLSRLLLPMVERLPSGSQGLDFGSGPGPTLSLMFEERGFTMAIYDPFYAADPAALQQRYDFISATEVVEHLRNPAAELERLWSLLKPDGWLGIMTKLVIDADAFSRWHYKNDPTHIAFFSRGTFEWLAQQWRAELKFIGRDVILLHKRSAAADSR